WPGTVMLLGVERSALQACPNSCPCPAHGGAHAAFGRGTRRALAHEVAGLRHEAGGVSRRGQCRRARVILKALLPLRQGCSLLFALLEPLAKVDLRSDQAKVVKGRILIRAKQIQIRAKHGTPRRIDAAARRSLPEHR